MSAGVTVYSKPACGPCRATKRWLDNSGVAYQEVPAAEHVDYLRELGHLEAPVVVTDREAWSGYRPDRLSNLRH